MADISLTAAKVAPVFPMLAKIFPQIAGEDLTAGQVVYLDTVTGKVKKCAAGGAAPANTLFGMALQTVSAGNAVAVLFEGHVAGFNISGLNYAATLYASNTAGALADAAGTTNLPAGKVVPMTDKDRTKVLYFKGSTL